MLTEQTKYNASNKLDMRTTFTYDKKSDVIESNFYNQTNSLPINCKTVYKNYDAKGNWLQAVQHTSKGSQFLIERSIEYYQ